MSNEVTKRRDQLVHSITKHQDSLYERLSGADDVVLFTANELNSLCKLKFSSSQADSAITQANTQLADASVLIAVRYESQNRRSLVSKM